MPEAVLDAIHLASDAEDAVNMVRRSLTTFAAGDVAGFRKTWADHDIDIVDDVAPYIWKGDDAVERWLADTGALIQSLGLTNLSITPGEPRRAEVSGDRAFVVLPVVVASTRDGRDYRQHGDQVLVLTRSKDGWKTQTMAYSGGETVPITP